MAQKEHIQKSFADGISRDRRLGSEYGFSDSSYIDIRDTLSNVKLSRKLNQVEFTTTSGETIDSNFNIPAQAANISLRYPYRATMTNEDFSVRSVTLDSTGGNVSISPPVKPTGAFVNAYRLNESYRWRDKDKALLFTENKTNYNFNSPNSNQFDLYILDIADDSETDLARYTTLFSGDIDDVTARKTGSLFAESQVYSTYKVVVLEADGRLYIGAGNFVYILEIIESEDGESVRIPYTTSAFEGYTLSTNNSDPISYYDLFNERVCIRW